MTSTHRIHRLLHFLAGGLILAGATWAGCVRKNAFVPQLALWLGLVLGLGCVMMGLASVDNRLTRASRGFCLSCLSLFVITALLQGFFQVIKFDFTRAEAKWRKLPPFCRQPMVATGSVFFRRGGPERWQGQVLNTAARQLHVSPNPYARDPEIVVNYDSRGFRNDVGLSDWEIAVAGDSFTELGYLPYEQLFTTLLGASLHCRVANLGVSYTGPLTQLSYLRDFGLAPGTHKTIIVFFEGNDLRDLDEEYASLTEYQKSGRRPYRNFNKQTSMLRALFRVLAAVGRKDSQPPEPVVTAYFKSGHGPVPITLNYCPPGRDQISPEALARLEYFFAEYEAFGKKSGLETWLAYVPCKERVVHGLIDYAPDAPERFRRWQPNDLPQVVAGLAASHAVRFADLTPALLEETARTKELLFNSIYDTHLTARGSWVVAQELARQLGAVQPVPGS